MNDPMSYCRSNSCGVKVQENMRMATAFARLEQTRKQKETVNVNDRWPNDNDPED